MVPSLPTDTAEDLAATPLPNLFELYERHRRLGPETRTAGNYRRAWNGLVGYLRDTCGREPIVTDLTTPAVTSYLSDTGVLRGWSEQTPATYGRDIASVVSSMRRHGLVKADTLAGFQVPKVTQTCPTYFDELTLARIFAYLERDRTTLHMRLRAVIQIMLDCGARPEEVTSLEFRHLDRERSQLHIRGKGARNRRVPVGDSTWRLLDDYMRVRPRPAAPTEPVFVSLRDRPTRVSPGTLASDMRDVLVALNLVTTDAASDASGDQGYRLYTMRKTFAHRAADNGMDIGELAAIMGHAPNSIPMLLRLYYQPSDRQRQEAHAAARPAESFHEWRAQGRAERAAEAAPLTYFERWASGPHNAAGGNKPSSTPSSRKRSNGEYRRASAATSAWPTGA
jgi:integrase/recombinase XerC